MPSRAILHFDLKERTGKSTLSAIQSFLLDRMKEKILLIDMDVNTVASKIIYQTFNLKPDSEKSIYKGLVNHDLNPEIVSITENLSIIPGSWELNYWNELNNNDYNTLGVLLKKIDREYNFIIIDVSTANTMLANNAILASSNIFLILENRKMSYTKFIDAVNTIAHIRAKFDSHFKVSGIIPYIERGNPLSATNQAFLTDSRKKFGKAVLKNFLWNQERIKAFTSDGIKNKEIWDERVLRMYQMILNEELMRMETK